jgi:N-acetylglucosaminyl-diphospho-decaprenol L-rhamnosyltransferase
MNSTAPLPTIHVVIVNWNAGPLLAACLQSFEAVAADAVSLSRVTIVDNGSSDGSLRALDDLKIKLPLEIVRNSDNRGFAAACNQGARNSKAEFLLFLNPDTCLTAGSLEKPSLFLTDAQNTGVGIVGIQLIDRQGNVARTCARRPSFWHMLGQSFGLDRCGIALFPTHFLKDWDHAETRTVDQVMGAFFFIRRSLFAKLDGFDERFFVYFEEVDLTMRARDLGWTSVYLATARAFHHGSGTTEQVKDLRLFYWWRSRILYAFKHFGILSAGTITLVTAAFEPIVRTLALLANMRLGEIPMVWKATRLLWANLTRMWQGETRSPAARGN